MLKFLLILTTLLLADTSFIRNDTIFGFDATHSSYYYSLVVGQQYFWEPINPREGNWNSVDQIERRKMFNAVPYLELKGMPKMELNSWDIYHDIIDSIQEDGFYDDTLLKVTYNDSFVILELTTNADSIFMDFNYRMRTTWEIVDAFYKRLDWIDFLTMANIYYLRYEYVPFNKYRIRSTDCFTVFTDLIWEFEELPFAVFYWRGRILVMLPTVHPYEWIAGMQNINKKKCGSLILNGDTKIVTTKDNPRFTYEEAVKRMRTGKFRDPYAPIKMSISRKIDNFKRQNDWITNYITKRGGS